MQLYCLNLEQQWGSPKAQERTRERQLETDMNDRLVSVESHSLNLPKA